ncbi:MAG: DUF4139 domain-containing protein [Acidobacteria bacterium]|nr:DUF4139 domain-containing protein [Acidobacteriota bacterium]
MRNAWKVAVVLLVAASSIQAEGVPVKSRLISLGLFKNGLTVVRRAVSMPGPGTYRIDEVPEPVHGTFWIEAGTDVEARMTSEVVDVPVHGELITDFQERLAGREVIIHFRDGQIPPATGTVVAIEPAKGAVVWARTREISRYNSYGSTPAAPSSGPFLILDGSDGRVYVDSSMIAYLRIKGGEKSVKERRPMLLLTVPETDRKQTDVFFSYLARGVSWAPSYRVDVSNPDTLSIEQNAVVKNELSDIEDAEISLISGFPSIQFANVTSPFSLETTWAKYFQELGQRADSVNLIGINVISRQAIGSNTVVPSRSADLSATPEGEGADLHFQSLGKRTLLEGDSMVISTASGKAPYKRIVEWIVPDTRLPNGRYIDEYLRQNEPEKYEDAVWDAVRFKNPLPFPMTTAPAMVISNGRFNGQRLTYWVNKGEETTLHITKALSIRTRYTETEQPGRREIAYIGGNDYREITVKGELKVNNHRKETVSIVIRRRFSGDLTSADGSPTCVLREEGITSVNRRNELTWTFDLNPGEEKILAYQYLILVDK